MTHMAMGVKTVESIRKIQAVCNFQNGVEVSGFFQAINLGVYQI